MTLRKILLVDDYALQLFIMENILDNKYKVKTINSCKNINEIIENYNPDLIILDLVMPNKSGLDILHDFGDKYKVIVVSSIKKEYIFDRVKSLGAKYYIEKPINLNILKDIID